MKLRIFPPVRRLREGSFPLAALALLFCLMASSTPRLFAQDTAKTRRKVVVMTEPDYPYVLRNGHFEGQVRLAVTVLPNGSVSKVECKGGNPMLAQYASHGRDALEIRTRTGPNRRGSRIHIQS